LKSLAGLWRRFSSRKSDTVFCCNICGNENSYLIDDLTREVPTCTFCRSSVRTRSIISLLSEQLFGKPIELNEFPEDPDISGIGLSDWLGYSKVLEKKFNYSNTYYHKPPQLDICSPDAWSKYNELNFIISTEVFEHVVPPVSIAFDNAYKMLKTGGVLILTVPYTKNGSETLEHFPNLHEFTIEDSTEETQNGETERFTDLNFHGGEGETLEMRLFCKESLQNELERAGFTNITFFEENRLDHGVYWAVPWSLPVVAIK